MKLLSILGTEHPPTAMPPPSGTFCAGSSTMEGFSFNFFGGADTAAAANQLPTYTDTSTDEEMLAEEVPQQQGTQVGTAGGGTQSGSS